MIAVIAGMCARLRSLVCGLRAGARVDAEMREEFRAHIELRAADLERDGASHDDAIRRARAEFGSADHYVDRGREARGLKPADDLRLSALDFKLGANARQVSRCHHRRRTRDRVRDGHARSADVR